jgi:hypothetical protein
VDSLGDVGTPSSVRDRYTPHTAVAARSLSLEFPGRIATLAELETYANRPRRLKFDLADARALACGLLILAYTGGPRPNSWNLPIQRLRPPKRQPNDPPGTCRRFPMPLRCMAGCRPPATYDLAR